MNWREWIFPLLQAASDDVDAGSVFAGGSLTGSPSVRPFIVYRIQEETPAIRDDQDAIASRRIASVWVYDNEGSYDRIDAILSAVRSALSGVVASPGAVCCTWQGDSGELADDELKAITRNSSFLLIGATS